MRPWFPLSWLAPALLAKNPRIRGAEYGAVKLRTLVRLAAETYPEQLEITGKNAALRVRFR